MKKEQSASGVLVLPSAAVPVLSSDGPPTGAETTTMAKIDYPSQVDAAALVPLYVLRKGSKPLMIAELIRFSTQYGSWFFVPNDPENAPHVCSNGNITMVTVVDPLFCALALLEARRAVGNADVFQPLDSLCITPDGTDIRHFCDTSRFELLCDVKEAAGQSFYRLSDDKTIDWLAAKHAALSKHPNVNFMDALDVLAQYITEKWNKRLRKQILGARPEETKTEKASEPAVNLALESIMQDAKEASGHTHIEPQEKRKGPARKAKQAKTKIVQKAPSASFWGTKQKSVKADASKKSLKRTRSASSTR